MPRPRHLLRRIWFIVGGAFAALAIALAVLMALGQLLVPLAAHFPDRVAHILSQRLDRPVSFGSMQGYWQPSGPLLVLHQVRIGGGAGKPAVSLPTARVKFDFGALAWPSRHWINLRLSGLRLGLERDAQGQWHVAGFGVAGGSGPQRIALADLPGNLWLDDLELDIHDVRSARHYEVHAGPVRVSNGGGELRFAGRLRRGTSARALQIAGAMHDGGRTGRLYLAARGSDFGAMLAGANVAGYAVSAGKGDLALWLAWRDGRLTGVTLDANVRDLKLSSPVGAVAAPALRGIVQFTRAGDRAQLFLAPEAGGAARVDVVTGSAGPRVVARAQDLDPGAWLDLGAVLPGVPKALGQWLVSASPHMHIAAAHVDWSRSGGIRAMAVAFDHLGLHASGARPGVDQLHGVLRGDPAAISLELPGQPMTLDFAHVFRAPIAFSNLGGDITFTRGADGWQAATPAIDFTSPGVAGQLRGRVQLPAGGGAPFLDLYADITRGAVTAAKQFWPVNIMPPEVVTWLDRGLAGGSVDAARVIMHGNMDDWPFTNHKGRFEALADVSGLLLEYDAAWPHAQDLTTTIDFVNNGLLATVSSAVVNGVKVTHGVASIPDLAKPELVLEASGTGKAGDMLGFVRTSPIGAPHATVLGALQLAGQGDFDFSMVLPLGASAPDPFTLVGTVRLRDTAVDASAWGLDMSGLHGSLVFDNQGFQTHDMAATLRGVPVTLDIALGPQTGHANWPLAVGVHGNFSLEQLARGRPELASLLDVGSGSAPFDIGFHIDSTANNPVHSEQVLTVQSNLDGIALDLPAPLAKPAQALWPLDVAIGLPIEGTQVRVILGNRLFARARLAGGAQAPAVEVRLGGLAPTAPMPSSGIRVRGEADQLDISGWVRYALSAAGGVNAQMPPIDVDVLGDSTHIVGGEFNKLRVQFHPSSTELALAVEGAQIQGTVTVPVHDTNKRGIVARFDRLYWPRAEEAKPEAAPATAASAVPAPVPTPAEAADVGVAPASLPPLHAWIADLRFGDAHLGQARLETYPTAKGMHIDMLRTESPSVHMAASGDWNGTAHASSTHLDINFSAANLGHMLDAFGFQGFITGGQTHAQLDATWPGAPSSFALANVAGTLDIDIGEGRIPDVKPGVGRLFGLMSIAELPRHLTVDFGNIFSKGFNFHSIKGHFRFDDGNAYTKDLKISGLAADITVTGRVGFRAHDYDQYVLAVPHVGNTLPIVGAVLGGPVGAAAGLAMQGLLGKGLNRAASARYHITGPWAKPVTTLVSKTLPQPATTAPAAAGSAAVPAHGASVSPAAVPAAATSVR